MTKPTNVVSLVAERRKRRVAFRPVPVVHEPSVPAPVEPLDTHREVRSIRSWGNKDVARCVDCGQTMTEIGVRLPDGSLAVERSTGTLATVVCPAWDGGEQ